MSGNRLLLRWALCGRRGLQARLVVCSETRLRRDVGTRRNVSRRVPDRGPPEEDSASLASVSADSHARAVALEPPVDPELFVVSGAEQHAGELSFFHFDVLLFAGLPLSSDLPYCVELKEERIYTPSKFCRTILFLCVSIIIAFCLRLF